MIDKEKLPVFAESYLSSIISEILNSPLDESNFSTPFQELGIDSFLILKIIKRLEDDFGVLPKTLLFENFNIEDLAQYFLKEYNHILTVKYSDKSNTKNANKTFTYQQKSTDRQAYSIEPDYKTELKSKRLASSAVDTNVVDKNVVDANVVDKNIVPLNTPILISEKAAYSQPILGNIVQNIFDQYKNEGSASRGTRNIAPNLFIDSKRKSYLNYSRYKNIILVYAYTGPEDNFTVIGQEIIEYCEKNNFEVNLMSGKEIESIGNIRISSTPFGVIQRILNIPEFTLKGNKMRRLRYQVSKFEKVGKGITKEYKCGSDSEVDKNIAYIIDQWCSTRTMVNPLINIVREEISTGTLNSEHRLFITYLNDVLQNVILISPLSSNENGYLMDLEFYPPDMPLGGLEFAIVKIIEALVAEGYTMLSLGGTYGCKLAPCSNSDPELDKILDYLREQNIFNDDGNLQFKNKFRPENSTVFICRTVENSNPDNVTDIIMMIANPASMQTSDEENFTSSEALKQILGSYQSKGALAKGLAQNSSNRPIDIADTEELVIKGELGSHILSECGYNPLNIPHNYVDFDLKTDSWAQLDFPHIEEYMKQLHAQLQQPVDIDKSLRHIFPFTHFALTTSGRTAESVFCRAWEKKGIVLQNLLFPTTIFNQIDNGFTPIELPHQEIFKLDSEMLFKGNLDWNTLCSHVEKDPNAIAFVCIEVSDNAAGGYPVSLQHLKEVKKLLARYEIPLVFDGTRVIENAQFLIENEEEHAKKTVWEVVREIYSYADAVVVSLAKDFCVNRGGLIATNNEKLFHKLQDLVLEEGSGLDIIDKRIIALSLQNRKYIEMLSLHRKEAVSQIWSVLKKHGIPVVQPAGGHCILVDVKQISEFNSFSYPVASFLAWMYLNTGLRAGAHNAGMQKNTPINDLVRLAIPVGLKPDQINEIIERIVTLFAKKKNIPEITMVGELSESLGDIHANYKLVKYHKLTGQLIPKASISVDTGALHSRSPINGVTTRQHSVCSQNASKNDIAIVGMAGRYPKAKNLSELWENLVEGKDCISDIPETRLEQRLYNEFTKKYRGGFIDDVDKFDAHFFSISPKDAEIMDPQERLFLEVVYEAIEDAGYYPDVLTQEASSRNIGVFVGAVWSMYQMIGLEEKIIGNNINPSSFFWSIANRVSYWMNFTGPSLTLDTACSASLTAVNLACESIYRGECCAAIVGGVNLDLHQSKFDINSSGGSLSEDGVCRSFGNGASGYVSGEGVGTLFLKPLGQAIVDSDNIHGVIKSALVTHSGRTSGYTIPSPQPQTELILKSLEKAKIDAQSVGYIEAHGTGTELGDAIEITGLTNAFQKYSVDKQNCPIGSIKTNIGHLEAASGIVGIQKILLQMRHRKLTPSLHSSALNENIDFTNSPFYVLQKEEEWKAKEVDGVQLPRRAGISAFGAGGTNAHIILEEYKPVISFQEHKETESREKIFPLSAKTEEQLRETAILLQEFIHKDLSISSSFIQQTENDIAHTLQLGRRSFDYRLVIMAKTKEDLSGRLTCFIEGIKNDDVILGHVKNAKTITGMLESKEKEDFVNLLVQSGDPRRLAKLWSDGVIPNWQGLEIGQRGKRISLPTYPFVKERYWIVNRKTEQRRSSSLINVNNSNRIDNKKSKYIKQEEIKPFKTNSANEYSNTTKIKEKYEFSLTRENISQAGQLSDFSVEEKSKLFIRQIFANQLKISINEVEDNCHLMDSGITSIDMAKMTQLIKEKIDPDFSPTTFFECTTIASLYGLLAQKYALIFEKMTVIKPIIEDSRTPIETRKINKLQKVKPNVLKKALHLQDAESELPISNLTGMPLVCEDKMRCILLTGATGFFGIHILAELLNSDSKIRVLCLVRARDKKHGIQRILKQAEKYELTVDKNQILILCGNLNKKKLGLAEKEWESCCVDIQQIIHASARVNHIEGYATFRNSTQGMKEIIRLASSQTVKLIQFISSTAVCAQKVGEEFSIFEKEDFISDGKFIYGGYGQSKWVQETFLKRAHEHGIPYSIYRFGELSGSSQTGLGQTDDMLHRLLQMRLAVGCREKISSDVLDMLPINFAAKLIVNIGKAPKLWNKILHATHTKPYSFASLYRQAEKNGLHFNTVTREKYLSKCYDFIHYISKINPVNGFVLECVLRDAEGSIKNRKVMDGYFAVLFPFDQNNFSRSLKILGLALPEWKSLIDKYLKTWSQDDCEFMVRIFDYQNRSKNRKEKQTTLEIKNKSTTENIPKKKLKRKSIAWKEIKDELLLENIDEA